MTSLVHPTYWLVHPLDWPKGREPARASARAYAPTIMDRDRISPPAATVLALADACQTKTANRVVLISDLLQDLSDNDVAAGLDGLANSGFPSLSICLSRPQHNLLTRALNSASQPAAADLQMIRADLEDALDRDWPAYIGSLIPAAGRRRPH